MKRFLTSLLVATACMLFSSNAHAWEAALPYHETFSDGTHYNGEDFVPNGWVASGNQPFVTANLETLPAVVGEYYLVTTPSYTSNRKDIVYTPLFNLKAGVRYDLTFSYHCPGGSRDGLFKVTVGDDQASDVHESVLFESSARVARWKKVELQFTPETAGEYCFAFWACSPLSNDGFFAIDDVKIYEHSDDGVPSVAPMARFELPSSLFSVFYCEPAWFKNKWYQFKNFSENGSTFQWSSDCEYLEFDDPTAEEPRARLKEETSNLITVKLKVTNEAGTTECTRSFSPIFIGDSGIDTDAFVSYNQSTDKIFSQGDTPAFYEDGTVQMSDTYEVNYMFVAGLNNYYQEFAERFEMPANAELSVSALNLQLEMYRFFYYTGGMDLVDDRDKNFRIKFYGETDGKIDTTKCFYQEEFNVMEKFSCYGIYKPVNHSITFKSNFKVKGTFYVAFEFDTMTINDVEGTVVKPTAAGFTTIYHQNRETSLFVRPSAKPEGCDVELGKYVSVDKLSPDAAGFGLGVVVWTDGLVLTDDSGVNTVDAPVLYASHDGNNYRVANVQPGAMVTVVDLNGRVIYNQEATSSEVIIPASNWSNGVYVIATNGFSTKVIK